VLLLLEMVHRRHETLDAAHAFDVRINLG